MAEEKKKKVRHLDDVLKDLVSQQSKDIAGAFKAHDEYTKPEYQEHIHNHILAPAQNKLYEALAKELDTTFKGNDEAKVHKKKSELKKAVTAGVKAYFAAAKPSVGEILDKLKMDEEQQYEFLTTMYDEHVGANDARFAQQVGIRSIKSLVEMAEDKEATVGTAKQILYQTNPKYVQAAQTLLRNKHIQHHLGKFDKHAVAGHLMPELEKAGYTIDDKLGYATADLRELIKLREGLVKGEGHSYLKKKKEEKLAA